MTKADLAKIIMNKSSYVITEPLAIEMVNIFMSTVKEEVSKGGSVQLVGFGTFTSTQRSARECRNPITNQKMTIPARKVPKFIPGTAFKECVNKK